MFLIIDLFGDLLLPILEVSVFIEDYWSIKLNVDWFSNCLGFDTGLNTVETQPFGIIRTAIKLINEFCIFNDTDMFIVILKSIWHLWLRRNSRRSL